MNTKSETNSLGQQKFTCWLCNGAGFVNWRMGEVVRCKCEECGGTGYRWSSDHAGEMKRIAEGNEMRKSVNESDDIVAWCGLVIIALFVVLGFSKHWHA